MIKNNKLFVIVWLSLLSILVLPSCTSSHGEDTPKQTVETSPKKVLRHVVALTFKEDFSETEQAEALQRFADLKGKVPEIIDFEGGKDLSVEGLTGDFTHCFILTFENEAARDAYLPHPAHMEVVKANKPMLSNLLVLDVWGEE